MAVLSQTRVIHIDPGGTPPVRPTGIALTVAPSGNPSLQDSGLTSNGVSSTGNTYTGRGEMLMTFSCSALLTEEEWRSLDGLVKWQNATRGTFGVVVYYLFDLFTEVAATRSRRPVPSPAENTATSVGGGLFQFSYYPVLQGQLDATAALVGNGHYATNINFVEGGILR